MAFFERNRIASASARPTAMDVEYSAEWNERSPGETVLFAADMTAHEFRGLMVYRLLVVRSSLVWANHEKGADTFCVEKGYSVLCCDNDILYNTADLRHHLGICGSESVRLGAYGLDSINRLSALFSRARSTSVLVLFDSAFEPPVRENSGS